MAQGGCAPQMGATRLVCEHRGGEHSPAEGSAWIAREQHCGVWAWWQGRSAQAPRVKYCPAITREVHRDKAGLRAGQRGSLVSGSVCGAGGQAQAQPTARVGDKQLWLSLKLVWERGISTIGASHSTIGRALPRVTRTPTEGYKCVSSRTFLVMDAFLCNVQPSLLSSTFQHWFHAQFLSLLKVQAAFWMWQRMCVSVAECLGEK